MEMFLQRELQTCTVRALSRTGGGCISDGRSYELDDGRKVFVKHNQDDKAKVMFDGEFAGLQALSTTKMVTVPHPHKVVPGPDSNGWIFVMDHLDITPLRKFMKELGVQLARLHLHNLSLKSQQEGTSLHSGGKDETSPQYIDKFGFESTTCCGFIPMPNTWTSDWIKFYASQRLQPQIDLVLSKYDNRQVEELWSHLQLKLPQFFTGTGPIYPSLLHGDLWSGNSGETIQGPVIFDPACLYGHHEFDLSIAGMFGGFNKDFYDSYHSLIPKSHGFETRQKLYTLFHYLNHWNHFGSSYQQQSISLMKELIIS